MAEIESAVYSDIREEPGVLFQIDEAGYQDDLFRVVSLPETKDKIYNFGFMLEETSNIYHSSDMPGDTKVYIIGKV